jgi:tRNA G18 (ribose-2'-O)-methylase SpoU
MVSRKEREERKEIRIRVERRYEKHRRRNLFEAVPGKLKFIIVLDNLKASFNIGKIFRSADALGAREVHLVGNHFFDPGPAMGSFKKVPARYFDTFEQSYEDLSKRGYTMFTLEPEEGTLLHKSKLPELSAFILGHEEFGISFDKNEYPGVGTIAIQQLGVVQSMNVSVAASIVMYEYFRQHNK